jgi:transcriptional regulator with XRE-family HTH domain
MATDKNGRRNALGSRLATLRKAAGLSQSALVERLQLKADWDCDKAVLASIENGRRSLTDLELLAILKVLKLCWADL